jgi:hypothetical protein
MIHRYLGIALAVPMLAWCLSGFVMMWVAFPKFDAHQRLQSLPPLTFSACCALTALRTTLGDRPIQALQIEMLSDRPVVRLETDGNLPKTIDLVTGMVLETVDLQFAQRISHSYLENMQLAGLPDVPKPVAVDQWTVGSEFNRDRPLYRVALNDVRATEIYISSRTGKVVQRTTGTERFGNYLGAVTHWIYPTMLRYGHPAVWNGIVIVLSAAGTVLTLLGIILGVVRARWSPEHSFSPWCGWRRWHHISGLLFGTLTLAWVGSGLLSMNPSGLLESDIGYLERTAIAGRALHVDDVAALVQRLAGPRDVATVADGAKQIASAPLGGVLYWVATSTEVRRLDPLSFESIPVTAEEVRRALVPATHENDFDVDYLPQGDAYLFPDPKHPVGPLYRAISFHDGSRYYLDALSGALIAKYDLTARRYRWWFEALHTWDFVSGYRAGPLWATVVTALLLGVTLSVGSGAFLGVRRLLRTDSANVR